MQLSNHNLEAQVDQLLVSLFNDNRNFTDWFCQQLNRKKTLIPSFDSASATRSPTRYFSRGQTDVGLTLLGQRRSFVLIENKVSHYFQIDQPERYREECDGLVAGKFADIAISVLVAPTRYIETIGKVIDKFDIFVSYEAIDQWLGGCPLLAKAITHCETGWIAEGIPAVSTNFVGYAELIKRAYPKLRLLTKLGNNPTQSRTAQFDSSFAVDKPFGVPSVLLLHQWQEGRAKLLFRGWGQHRGLLIPFIAADVAPAGMVIDPNRSKSLGIMIETPRINNHGNFSHQIGAFISGLDAVMELRKWYLENIPIVSKWVEKAADLK
jgi:hypothetical protein